MWEAAGLRHSRAKPLTGSPELQYPPQGLRVPGILSCLLNTRLVQVLEQRSEQDTAAKQMIRLHVLMPRSTRKLQSGVVGYTQVTRTQNRD